MTPAEPETPRGLTGSVTAIDKFGAVATTLTMADLTEAGMEPGDVLRLTVGGQRVEAPWVTAADDVPLGQPLVLVDQVLHAALSRGDFATAYAVGSRGDSAVYELTPTALRVELAQKGGYAEELNALGLAGRLSTRRQDHSDDGVFANFREVRLGRIAPGVLYRSASPIEEGPGRNTYADALLAEAGIKTIVNMADCRAKAPNYPAFAGTAYEQVHNDDGVVYLNMGSDMYAKVGLDDLKNGLSFLSEREGPYLIHSTYGADRTGHMVLLLEALMGAEVSDIVADYMRSFQNLYGVAPDTEAWRLLAQGGVQAELIRLLDAPDFPTAEALAAAVDETGRTGLERAAERYLLDAVGLTQGEVDGLKAHLSGQTEM